MKMSVNEALAILNEIKDTDQEAFERLKDKSQWERMSQLSVLIEWGDPRKW